MAGALDKGADREEFRDGDRKVLQEIRKLHRNTDGI